MTDQTTDNTNDHEDEARSLAQALFPPSTEDTEGAPATAPTREGNYSPGEGNTPEPHHDAAREAVRQLFS